MPLGTSEDILHTFLLQKIPLSNRRYDLFPVRHVINSVYKNILIIIYKIIIELINVDIRERSTIEKAMARLPWGVMGYDYEKARKAGDTYYLLQGRDENGLRRLRSSNKTLRYGSGEEQLFANQDNEEQLAQMIRDGLTVKQAIDRYSSNFLESYSGYHSK